MIDIPLFSQSDDRWSGRKLSPSDITMCQAGCFVTSMCMALWSHGFKWTPDGLLDRLISAKGLNAEGMLIHSSVSDVTGRSCYVHSRVHTDLDPRNNGAEMQVAVAAEKVRKLLLMGQPVILTVDAVGNDGIADHAIVAYDPIVEGGKLVDAMVCDPCPGWRGKFSERYGKLAEKLYGYVAVIGPPTSFPDGSPLVGAGHALWKASQIAQGIAVETYSRELIDTLLTA